MTPYRVGIRTVYYDEVEVEAPDEATASLRAQQGGATKGMVYSESTVEYATPVGLGDDDPTGAVAHVLRPGHDVHVVRRPA